MSEQGRDPPAFQVYAANVLASRRFKLLNARDRGVDYSMRLECWVNRSMPADPAQLAMVLGLSADDVAASLPNVMADFALVDGEIVCPELDAYRAHLDRRNLAISEGASKGAALTNEKRWGGKGKKRTKEQRLAERSPTPSPTPSPRASPTPSPSGRPLSTVQHSPVQIKSSAVAPGKVVTTEETADPTDGERSDPEPAAWRDSG